MHSSVSHFHIPIQFPPERSLSPEVMPSAAVPQLAFRREASNYDEASMHQSLLFADSLKDLKNLRTQLYSAAKYFELSFTNDDQKHMVIETLKDYTVKALVNTVDHLGSVSNKLNDLLEERIGEAGVTNLKISCIEQRMRTCEIYMNHEGRAQQSSAVSAPKYHKRYTLPANETLNCSATHAISTNNYETITDNGDTSLLKIGMTPDDTSTLTDIARNQSHSTPITLTSQHQEALFSKKAAQNADIIDKRMVSVSPHPLSFLRSGSLAGRMTNLNPNRSITPRILVDRRLSMPEQRKSASMRFYGEENTMPRYSQHQPSKSKRLLKALLSRRKSRKDEMLYTFLNEY